jgi:RND superfamily putative drug exporter
LDKIARWCFRHRYFVVGFWVVALVVSYGLTQSLGTNYSDSFSLPSTDSTKALDLLKTVSPGASGETDTVVWHVGKNSVHDPAVEQQINVMLTNISKIPQVASVTSPYGPMGVVQISRDERTAYAQVSFTKQFQDLDKENIKTFISTAEAARAKGLQVEVGGQAIEQSEQTAPSSSAGVGVLAAAVVLFIAFGSLFGMLVPLITALLALGVGISLVGLLTHWLSIATFAPTLGALVGLGVGIDYALFIITRYRSGLLGGLSPEESTVKALNTAGRAVLFAGGTVCVALLGLLTLKIGFLGGVGIAAASVVLVTVLGAVTLLPALLGIFRTRILSRKARRQFKKDGPVNEATVNNMWARNARFVENHSWLVAGVALVIIAILIVPFASLRIGSSDASNDPVATTTHQAYVLLADGFGPGFNGPLQLVGAVTTPEQRAAFSQLAGKVEQLPGVAQVEALPSSPESKVGIIQVVPKTSPESQATSDLITHLRKVVIPAAESGTTLHVYVGGITAIFNDFSSVIASKLPLFLGVIIGLGFLILMIAFRSLVIPLTAAAMNLLAAGAAFGVVVTVFQWGWLSGILHTGGPGPVEAFLPVMMLAILFGLSMDYQVFLVSRMHEEWVHSNDNDKAVRIGQTETGRVITAAATIMILVFMSFVFGGQRVIAEFGVGLASAVLIDAFILRNFLVPALMHRFGRANWWLPKWLDRILPHLSVEPAEDN